MIYIFVLSCLSSHILRDGWRRVATGGSISRGCRMRGICSPECGRDGWVRYAVDTVKKGNLDGVFFDGFQGCSGDGGDHQVYRIKVYLIRACACACA